MKFPIVLRSKLKRWRTAGRQAIEASQADIERLETRVQELETQNESIRGYAQACADAIGTRLPGIDVNDASLINLVNKLIAELDDARANPEALQEIASMIGASEPTPRVVMDRIVYIAGYMEKSLGIIKSLTVDLKPVREWLKAVPGESTLHAAQRVVTTLEVAPGAAREVQKAREIVGAQGGETLVEALTKPIDFTVVIQHKGSEFLGGQLKHPGPYPKLGEIEVKIEEVK